jgi:hypothetical protein
VIDVAKSGLETDGIPKWPEHWVRVATYGKKVWGVVLGDPLPVVIRKQSEDADAFQLESLMKLENASTGSLEATTLPDSESLVEDDWLVDRFLVFLAEEKKSSKQLGWFFQLSDMSSRLLDEEFSAAARKFTQAAGKNTQAWRLPPTVLWDSVRSGGAAWGIAYPGVKQKETSSENADFAVGFLGSPNATAGTQSSDGGLKIATYDAGHGLMASMTSTNRQSATSTYFLEWMNNDNQRIAFGAATERVQTLSGAGGVTQGAEVLYQRRLTEAWGGNVPNELRFAGAYRYRHRLQQMLEAIIANPASIDEEIANCNQDWDKITEELGRATQRTSVERSLFLAD